MPAIFENKKFVVGAGLGVAIAASTAFAAYVWYDKRNKKKVEQKFQEEIHSKDQKDSVMDCRPEEESSLSGSSLVKEQFSDPILVQRGGRKNYRAISAQREAKKTESNCISKECQPKTISWSEEVEKSQREGLETLSSRFKAYCRTEADGKEADSPSLQNLSCSNDEEEELKRVLAFKQHTTMITTRISSATKHSQPVESPSLGSDIQSETSQDSGRGGSTGVASSMSPVEELAEIEVPPMYEFEIPQSIVGLIIGKKGVTIKDLSNRSGAHIVIRHHWFKDNYKICTIEGTRDQINSCLRNIRRRFPPSRFPELNLNPLLPPPVTSPKSSMWESMIRLSLPEQLKCEVVVSSMVDAGHIFLQQPTHPSFPFLSKLDQFMLAVYSQSSGVPDLPKPIELGVICAAPVLGGWYRAQTMHYYEEDDEVLIRFEDYGGYSRLPASDLRQIRSDFMNIPFQAIECYLAHVSPVGEEGWSTEASECFAQLAMTSVIEAKVVKYASDGLPLVELFCVQGSELVDINRTLYDNGFANWVSDEGDE